MTNADAKKLLELLEDYAKECEAEDRRFDPEDISLADVMDDLKESLS